MDMDYEAMVKAIQGHFTDGLTIVVGSGLSAAEGIPGMVELASHLASRSKALTGADFELWGQIIAAIGTGIGLEAALLQHEPSDTLVQWIAKETCELLLPREQSVVADVLRGSRVLRLTSLLRHVVYAPGGLPIITTNYDRLVEVACEMAGFHVDTTAIGLYAGAFDHERSCMGSCRGVRAASRRVVLDHYPRAIVLKPHGSLDWYQYGEDARRCSMDVPGERLIVTPGLNKYRAGYDAPFDKHRDLGNDHIKRAARLLVVGFGFNDEHLETHLVKRIRDGVPTIIMNRSMSSKVEQLAVEAPNCMCLSRPTEQSGTIMVSGAVRLEQCGQDLWDLDILTKDVLT